MPKIVIAKDTLETLPIPPNGYVLYMDAKTPHLGVRVSPTGGKVWILERRFHGKTVRRTLGDAQRLTYTDAKRECRTVNGDLERGADAVTLTRQSRQASKQAELDGGVTLRDAMTDYLEKKRRAKDDLPLKARTKADYLAMLDVPRLLKNGTMTAGGPLRVLGAKRLKHITADDVRTVHALATGERRKAYCMQVLRAVMNWHGVAIPDSPLGKDQAGKDRIRIMPSRSAKNPIPGKQLGAWWNACMSIAGDSADYYRVQLLTGCRDPRSGRRSPFPRPISAQSRTAMDASHGSAPPVVFALKVSSAASLP